jgi:hypothetical protein
MSQSDSDKALDTWAKRNAQHLVDGILGASERSGWPWHPTPDQVALLREIARRAIWHMRWFPTSIALLSCILMTIRFLRHSDSFVKAESAS